MKFQHINYKIQLDLYVFYKCRLTVIEDTVTCDDEDHFKNLYQKYIGSLSAVCDYVTNAVNLLSVTCVLWMTYRRPFISVTWPMNEELQRGTDMFSSILKSRNLINNSKRLNAEIFLSN